MKTIKIACLLIFLFFNIPVFAQTDTLKVASISHKAEAMASRMEQELNLSASQKTQILNILVTRLDNIKSGTALDEANSKGREKLATILTKEQYALYLKLREDTRKQKEDFLKKNPSSNNSEQDLELDF